MLQKKFNNSNSSDFTGFMKREVVENVGINPDLTFVFAGVEPETINAWDDEARSYTDQVVGYRYPVMQDTIDENGNSFQQNPVLVRVDGDPLTLNFGDKVQFTTLLGYRNKRYQYSFQARSIKKAK